MASEYETLLATGYKRNPVQETRFQELQSTGSVGNPKGIESPTGSYLNTANIAAMRAAGDASARAAGDAARVLAESKAAARGELEGVRPKIAEIYSSKEGTVRAEIEPTKARYDSLLEEVTRRQAEEETRATLQTGRELGRRGITDTSGLGERTINEALSPISRFYTGQAKDVGFEREDSLRNLQAIIAGLGESRSQQEISLAQQLANIESTYGSDAASVALQQAQAQALAEQNRFANEMSRQQQSLSERQQTFSETQFFPELERQYLEAQIAQANRPPASSGGGTNALLQAILDRIEAEKQVTPVADDFDYKSFQLELPDEISSAQLQGF